MRLGNSIRRMWVTGWMLALVVAATSVGGMSVVRADEVAVAAASDLNFAIKELIAEYEKQSGHHVKLSLGSSGNFYAQLQQGAPFDLYFSADIGYPKKLEEAGLTVPGTLYRYAIGRVVLWAPKSSSLDVAKGSRCFGIPGFGKLPLPIRSMRRMVVRRWRRWNMSRSMPM